MKRKLYLGRSAILGLRFGAFLLGIIAALALAYIGVHTYQSRTGFPGGELTIAPAFVLFFYIGWTAKEGCLRRKAAKRRAQKKTTSEEDGLHDTDSISDLSRRCQTGKERSRA